MITRIVKFRSARRRRTVLQWLNEHELPIVRHQYRLAKNLGLSRIAAAVNILGNGWIYAVITALLLAHYGLAASSAIISAVLAVGIAHAFYPFVKKKLARVRPFSIDGRIDSNIKPLDEYSCPSGHCMTASAAFTTIDSHMPELFPVLLIVWAMIAWGRLAVGHHFPSDVAFGTLIGGVAGLAIIRFVDVSKFAF